MSPPPPVYPPLHLEPRLAGGYCERKGITACAAVSVSDEGLVLNAQTLGTEEVTILASSHRYFMENSERRFVVRTPQTRPVDHVFFALHTIYGLVHARLKLRAIPEIWRDVLPDAQGRIEVWFEAYADRDTAQRKVIEALLQTQPPEAGLVPVQALKVRGDALTLVSFADRLVFSPKRAVSVVLANGETKGTIPSGYPALTMKRAAYQMPMITHVPGEALDAPFTLYGLVDGKLTRVFTSDAVTIEGKVMKGYAQWWGDDGAIAFTPDKTRFVTYDETYEKYDHYWILEWRDGAFVVKRRPK